MCGDHWEWTGRSVERLQLTQNSRHYRHTSLSMKWFVHVTTRYERISSNISAGFNINIWDCSKHWTSVLHTPFEDWIKTGVEAHIFAMLKTNANLSLGNEVSYTSPTDLKVEPLWVKEDVKITHKKKICYLITRVQCGDCVICCYISGELLS